MEVPFLRFESVDMDSGNIEISNVFFFFILLLLLFIYLFIYLQVPMYVKFVFTLGKKLVFMK